MNKDKGFTLVELMIVVAIIGVLTAIAFPSYDSFMKKGRRADAKTGVSIVIDRLERYNAQQSTYTDNFANLNLTGISEEGHYDFTIAVTNGGRDYLVTATPRSTGDQTEDTTTGAGDCTQLTIDSTGLKMAIGALDPTGTDDTIPDCW